jgi:hypothetical protein
MASPLAQQHSTSHLKKEVVPGDIVIRNPRPGAYVIGQLGGEDIGTSQFRFEAMRRACAVARSTGANVWIDHAESSSYHEVLCP